MGPCLRRGHREESWMIDGSMGGGYRFAQPTLRLALISASQEQFSKPPSAPAHQGAHQSNQQHSHDRNIDSDGVRVRIKNDRPKNGKASKNHTPDDPVDDH